MAFCCSYCGIASAEQAGTDQELYPSGLTIIQLPCAGRIDVRTLLRTFREGADAVVVVGCLEGNCNFQYGNLEARKKVQQVQAILSQLGIEAERLEMFNIASNQGHRFAQMARDMDQRAERLGALAGRKVRR